MDQIRFVRVKSGTDQIAHELRYTFVRLPSADVDTCIAAICNEFGVVFTAGTPVSWVDSKTLLRGPLNHAFLQSIPAMQDFGTSLVDIGNHGDVGLLLEMGQFAVARKPVYCITL